MRKALLEAALDLFARKGFEGVSLSEIARAAGATPPLVSYYFHTKEALWKAAVTSVFGELRDKFRDARAELRDLDPAEALSVVARRFIHFSGRHPEVAIILSHQVREESPLLKWLIEEHVAPLESVVLEIFREGQRQGVIKPGRPELLVQIAVGASIHFLLTRPVSIAMHGIDPLDPAILDEHADLVVETMMSGTVVGNRTRR